MKVKTRSRKMNNIMIGLASNTNVDAKDANIDERKIEEYREIIKKMIGHLTFQEPFLGLFLKETPIIYRNEDTIAYTDGNSIYLGKEAFKLPPEDLLFALVHEVLHITHLHPTRGRRILEKYTSKYPSINPTETAYLINVASDAVVNKIILKELGKYNIKPTIKGIVTCEEIYKYFIEPYSDIGYYTFIDKCENASVEDILDILLELISKHNIKIPRDLVNEKMSDITREVLRKPSQQKSKTRSQKGEKEESEEEKQAGERVEEETKEKIGKETGKGGKEKETSRKAPGSALDKEKTEESKESESKEAGEKAIIEEREPEEVVLNEGDRSKELEDREPSTREKNALWRTLKVHSAVKAVGKGPGWVSRIIEEILKPKINWKVLLKRFVGNILRLKDVRRTWTRTSKKVPAIFPGKRLERSTDVIVAVDTSGSISEKELQQFVSEIYEIAKETSNVIVIPWDIGPYDEIVIRSRDDAKKIKLIGGGGTMIGPVLEYIDKRYGNRSNELVLVILSDWMIDDLEREETGRLLRKYNNRLIAITTKNEPPKYLIHKFKIDFSETETET